MMTLRNTEAPLTYDISTLCTITQSVDNSNSEFCPTCEQANRVQILLDSQTRFLSSKPRWLSLMRVDAL